MTHVDQVIESAMPGDGVFNCVLAFRNILERHGCKSRVFARHIHRALKKQVLPLRSYDSPNSNSLLIYHFAIGADTTQFVASQKGKTRLALMYHNMTPAKYLRFEDPMLYHQLKLGQRELEELRQITDTAIAASEYNKQELLELGYQKVGVVPPANLGDVYQDPPDKRVLQRFDDGTTNLLFVGRIVPNKKQEDVIKAFYYYKRINPASRLVLVGSLGATRVYYRWLQDLIDYLGVKDIHFAGHVSQAELKAYYKVANVFVSMSEHEGFCIPLVESMYFDVPVIAYSSSAIPETVGRGGILVKEKNLPLVAELINLVVSYPKLRERLIAEQRKELDKYRPEAVEAKFCECLAPFLDLGIAQ